jgi:GMP synthase-like glutamine amidotransferase
MKPWLVIRNTPLEGLDLLGDVLQGEGIEFRIVEGGESPEVADLVAGADAVAGVASMGDLGGLVILGGPMGVYEEDRYPALGAERRLARRAVEQGLPVLGICLGAQLLASALGARVYPGPRKEIGWEPLVLTEAGSADPVLGPLTKAPVVFHLHGDTFDLPAGAVHLARTAGYAMQAFRVGTRAYGLQFHLEFSLATVRAVLGDSACRADLGQLGQSPEQIAAASAERIHALQPTAIEVFQNFVRLG